MTSDPAGAVRSTCPYCGVGCGIVATPTDDGSVRIAGDPDHPANMGRLCSKGAALAETLVPDGRLLHPERHGKRIGWNAALDEVATRFSETIDEHGLDSVAFYVSGQLLTEDYYVANKLMKGFIGSANIDTNSRLCMASSVAGHKRAFGADTVPGCYEDLELADTVVLVGSNLAWCHPVLYQRLAAARAARPDMRVVLVDPRRTMTADIADMHLPIAPDGDVALFSGLLCYLHETGRVDQPFIDQHVSGAVEALKSARLSPAELSRQTGLSAARLAEFYQLWAGSEKVVTVYSQGVNQSITGTDKVNAILNCHLLTGRIGRPGMGPFSVTGQPNAMGGRETGGLANMLAAHMDLENAGHRRLVQNFWQAPTMARRPGKKAVDLFRDVAAGKIRALWIMATNPVVSMPDANAVQAALDICPFVVVSDVIADTDTSRQADLKLPSLAWGEKNGTVTNSERRISRQRGFLPPPGEAQADWWQMAEVARRMGFAEQFPYTRPDEIFMEYASLTALENNGDRDLDLGGLATLLPDAYDQLDPVQWPVSSAEARSSTEPRRFFAKGAFYHPDGKARMIAVTPEISIPDAARLTLNTGRVRDHWHTMTRTGLSPRLSQHMGEPFAEIHPDDAVALNVGHADLVHLETDQGTAILRVMLSENQQRGSVFVPIHWNDEWAAEARISSLIAGNVDPVSGQPGFKNVPVRAARFDACLYGFAVTRDRPVLPDHVEYWAIRRIAGGWAVEFASLSDVAELEDLTRQLSGIGTDTPLLGYHDQAGGDCRFAAFDDVHLQVAAFMGPAPVAVSRPWAAELPTGNFDTAGDRWRVLAGQPGGDVADKGAIVCSCYGVGANQIARAVHSGCQTVAEVTDATGAGGNCGSCKAEIGGLIDEHQIIAAE